MPGRRRVARISAHAIVLLLALAWVSAAGLSLSSPLFDIGRARIGDAIIAAAGVLDLTPHGTLMLAHAMASLKLAIGLYLVLILIVAVHDRIRWGASDDAMLDVGLFLSAVGSAVAIAIFAARGGRELVGALGEIILCVMASVLAAYGNGEDFRLPHLWRRRRPEPAAA